MAAVPSERVVVQLLASLLHPTFCLVFIVHCSSLVVSHFLTIYCFFQIAHAQVQFKLLDLIYHGFLISVMASSLSQVRFVG